MKSEKLEKMVLIGMFWILLFLAMSPCVGQAAIPQKINYQGYLTSAAGVPVNGTVQIVFSIYNVPTGGTGLWTETQNVTVTHGVYNVELGDVSPVNLAFDVQYYLGIMVGTDPEMTPRIPLTSVGYAFRAQTVEVVGSHTHSGADITSGTVAEPRIDPLIARNSQVTAAVSAHALRTDNPHSTTAAQTGAVALNQANSITSGMIVDGTIVDADISSGAAISFSKVSGVAASVHTHSAADITSGTLSTDRFSAYADLVVEGHLGSDIPTLIQADARYIKKYSKVAVVELYGHGDYTNPVTPMADSSTWCGTPSATNPCLLKIMPGIYDIGTGTVVMQPYIDIEGSGQNVTMISGAVYGGDTGPSSNGVVNCATNAEIRFISVRNTFDASGWAVAILNSGQFPAMTNVTAIASGVSGFKVGVFIGSSSSPTMTNVTAIAVGGGYSYGVYNNGGSPTMTNITATASGATYTYTYGVFNSNSNGSPTMNNVTATATGGTNNYGVVNYGFPTMSNVTATAGGGTNNYGVNNANASSPTMNNVTATAKDGSGDNNGVYNTNAPPVMINVIASGTGGSNSYGVYNDSSQPIMKDVLTSAQSASGLNLAIRNDGSTSYPILTNVTANAYGGSYAIGLFNTGSAGRVNIDRSTFSGLGGSVESRGIRNDANQVIQVGSSKLSGASSPFGGQGTPGKCIYCYNDTYDLLNGNCQ